MEQTNVGRSGLRIPRLGLGTLTWGAGTDREAAKEILRRFTRSGAPLIDVTPQHTTGMAAMEYLGTFLGSEITREDLIISASAGTRPDRPVGRRVDCSRRGLLSQLDSYLTVLGTDHLDLFSIDYWDELTPVEEVADTLDYAVRTGRVRYVGARGLSGWQLAVLRGAAPAAARAVVCAGETYNLLNRLPEQELLPAADHHQMGFIAGAPLAHGVLTGKYREPSPNTEGRSAEAHAYSEARDRAIVEALTTAAMGLNISATTAAIAWVLAQPGVSATLVGARTPEHCDEAFAAAEVQLPKAIIEALDDISL
ncbi:General stress protein 69 [Corynebacterium ciconiae DSM 44920]|uniref:aldo/keto reductase n=1 Tax=Corynebacterium ciconiae TaxID=227319 RepID=UPI0003811C31|nr:aldo/keto reductase [Corynebacterium ciconiae]WKD61201.1 General stress protein 69 [Corynebacterium ciconiae DSM 44920]